MRRLLFAAVALGLACGTVTPSVDGGAGGGGGGGGATGGGGGPTGGGSGSRVEVVGAAGRVSGGGFTVDVQVGRAVQPFSVSGGGRTVRGQAAVVP